MSRTAVINRRDLDFLLFDWLCLNDVLAYPRFEGHSVDDVAAMLTVAQDLAETEIAPHLRDSDSIEPRFERDGRVIVLPAVADGVRRIAELGIFGAVFDHDLGGLQLPNMVYVATMGLLMSGAIATPSFMLLTVGNARLIAAFGSPEQVDAFARPQAAGEALGTMCLSEPGAGSSLGDIRTIARPDGEDDLGRRFRLFGNKMWISGGDHDITDNIVHLVLAKVPGEDGRMVEGTRGISLFIVPKILPDGAENDVVVAGLNHKMGYRGLPNCALNFGEGHRQPAGDAGAIGWLIGEVGRGLPQMFQMMNEARISVGLGGAMLAYRGYLLSLDYARNRLQGRRPGQRTGAQIAIAEHADVKRMLLAQKAYCEGALALVLYSARLLDDETSGAGDAAEQAGALLALLTPVTKTWPSEFAQRSLDLAIQIHGGAGYTRDYEVEQLYRDNRLNPIHEGTTGIQAVDLAVRKIRGDDGRTLHALRLRVEATIATAKGSARLAAQAEAVAAAWAQVDSATRRLLDIADDAAAIVHATPFLFGLGHAVIGWLWLDVAAAAERRLATADSGGERSYLDGKIAAGRYFAEFELPRVAAWLHPIALDTDVIAAMQIHQFLGEAG
ncbi:acyl-CoA dehydrogenase [Sphingomonas profundi]|uniref:acyl-CoA dehydrogenase n=1 Tax=Alterirhizorhabdus profundi TaxID=2681549 RepID=UPI0012E87C7F|nr:acyl-CoA dehydrogenase [Sphingomonas profundi]